MGLINHRVSLVLFTACLTLSACGSSRSHKVARSISSQEMAMSADMPAAPAVPGAVASRQKLAYSHSLYVRVPAETLERHFTTLLDSCLKDSTQSCAVMSAVINRNMTGGRPSAKIQVRLPHEAVPGFIETATRPLDGEAATDVGITSRSVSATDLSVQTNDADRRIRQLTEFRDRLEALSARPGVKTEDLIKIAGELSETQTQLSDAQAQLNSLNQRVETEVVTVSYNSIAPEAGPVSPLTEAWRNASATFIESSANVLNFSMASLPWIPVVVLAGAVGRTAMRRWKWRPWRRKNKTDTTAG